MLLADANTVQQNKKNKKRAGSPGEMSRSKKRKVS